MNRLFHERTVGRSKMSSSVGGTLSKRHRFHPIVICRRRQYVSFLWTDLHRNYLNGCGLKMGLNRSHTKESTRYAANLETSLVLNEKLLLFENENKVVKALLRKRKCYLIKLKFLL